jgi:pimeloyl-ACP methyl ester carboxylesterase
MSIPVVLIPGAGGQGWGWHLVEADLRRRGYDALAVDLPAADESQGLPAYLAALSHPEELSAAVARYLAGQP